MSLPRSPLRLPLSNEPFNQRQAFAEGWGIFSGRIGRMEYGPWENGIHTQGTPVFESDEAAAAWVQAQHEAGSPYHATAIRKTQNHEH